MKKEILSLPVNLQSIKDSEKGKLSKKTIIQSAEILKLKNSDSLQKNLLKKQNPLTVSDIKIVFKNDESIEGIKSLSFIVADQNVDKFFKVLPLTEKAQFCNFKLEVKNRENFVNQDLQNFTLSWRVFVYQEKSDVPIQILDVDDQVFSQKVSVNQVFAPKVVLSNQANETFNQYYNPSIWYVGNNTYFIRADADKGANYEKFTNVSSQAVKQVESWSYDGGKTWTQPTIFLSLKTSDDKASVARGITFFDSALNKLVFIADFWGRNLGPLNKGDSNFALTKLDGLWRILKQSDLSKTRALILVDDSDFESNQTLYFQVYKRKMENKGIVITETEQMYSENKKNNQISDLSLKYDAENVWVELKYDPTTGDFSSKVVSSGATDLSSAKSMFSSQENYIFDGSNSSVHPNSFKPGSYVTTSGPLVFSFEKDLNLPIEQRQWKLISKYPENYNFAAKDATTKMPQPWNTSLYFELNPGNGVVLKNGTYGFVFNHDERGTTFLGRWPSLVTGKYDEEKKLVVWKNQTILRRDLKMNLLFAQIASGSNDEEEKFAFLPLASDQNNGLIFYKSSSVDENGDVAVVKTAADTDKDNKNSLGFPINSKDFHLGFAGFQSAQGESWFVVSGPSATKNTTYDQDGIVLLVNKDFSKIYPLTKMPGSFRGSVINIESARPGKKGLTDVKLVLAYEVQNETKTEIHFQKYDFSLDLKQAP